MNNNKASLLCTLYSISAMNESPATPSKIEGIDINSEFNLIRQKKSKLSRARREQVIREYAALEGKEQHDIK